MWEPYLRATLPRPTDTDRARLERLAGFSLPDRYWALATEHQGEGLDEDEIADPRFASLILLLVSAPEAAGKAHDTYCVETCLQTTMPRYPAGLFPFADDTGGNLWAFDFRTSPADPAIVFVDHEIEGEDGVTPVSPSFDAFMARIGVVS